MNIVLDNGGTSSQKGSLNDLVFMSLQMVSRAEAIQHHSVVCHMRAIENAPQQHFKLLEQNRLRQDKAPKLIQVCSLCPVNLLRRCW